MKSILDQYTNLIRERDETKARIDRLNAKLERINEEGVVKDSVKGGMGNFQTFIIEGFPTAEEDELRAHLSKQRRILKDREADIVEKTTELEAWLNTIDSRMRRIITKRCIEEKTWQQVAYEMGKHYTEESCKKLYQRFLKEGKEK